MSNKEGTNGRAKQKPLQGKRNTETITPLSFSEQKKAIPFLLFFCEHIYIFFLMEREHILEHGKSQILTKEFLSPSLIYISFFFLMKISNIQFRY